MSARGRPVTTLAPGDRVTVRLRGRATDRVNAWGGEVVAADGTALRLRVSWYRFGLGPCPAAGERVIPWGRIEDVRLEAAS